MRGPRWAALAAVVALAAGGCTASPEEDEPAAAGRIDAATDTDVQVTDEWTVQVPAGAAPDGATLSADLVDADDLAGALPELPGVEFLQAADVSLSSGQPDAPVTFTYRLDEPLPEGTVLYLVDDTADAETVAAAAAGEADPTAATVHVAEMSADRRTGTVAVDHLSLKSWFQARVQDLADFAAGATDLLGRFTGQRTDPPRCSGSRPAWMTQDPVFLDDRNAPMRICVERDSNDPETAVVKIANNRGGFMRVTSPVTPSWAWQSMLGADVKSWMNDFAARALRTLGVADDELSRSWLLPPGAQVHIGFSQQAVAGENPLAVRAHMPLAGAAGGFAYSLLDLADSPDPVYALALFTVCAQGSSAYASDHFDAAGLALAVVKFATCAVDKPQAFLDVLEDRLPADVFRQTAPTARSVLSKAKARLGPVVAIGQVAFIALDLGTTLALDNPGAWTITLYPPPPTGGTDPKVVRFDGIGDLTLRLTADDLVASGYVNQGNLYEGMDAACVRYTRAGGPLSASVESATGRVLAVQSSSAQRTQVGNIRVGSTLAQVRSAFSGAGYESEEILDGNFGQGLNGVIVNGPGGAIGLGLDDASAAEYAAGTPTVNWIAGVGLPGDAPTASETGC